MRRLWLVLALCLLNARGLAATPPSACPPPVEETDGVSLPHLTAIFRADPKAGRTLKILAVGAGPAKPSGFYTQLAHALETSVRGLHVTMTIQGGGGLPAAAEELVLAAALKQNPYDLVIWQTGTLEAVRAGPTEDFYQALSNGADLVEAAGAELVLVEPQYSQFLEDNANPQPYLSAMQSIATQRGILLFHRYALMHDWQDAGLIDLEHAAHADRAGVAAKLHACLAGELSRALLSASVR
jgi:hypothetical protein